MGVPEKGPRATASQAQHIVTASEPAASSTIQTVVEKWNAREWGHAGAGLVQLEGDGSLPTSTRQVSRHLRGIALNITHQYEDANRLFEQPLLQTATARGTVTDIKECLFSDFERASAHWFGITSLLRRRFDDAAFAFAISASNTTANGASAGAQEQQALEVLGLVQKGEYHGKKQYLEALSTALINSVPTNVRLLPQCPSPLKAKLIAAALPLLRNEYAKPHFEDLPAGVLAIAPHTFDVVAVDQLLASAPILAYDPTLLVGPRRYAYLSEFGMDVAMPYLQYRFLYKVHFPTINVTALHTTRRPLDWLVGAITRGLGARGFLVQGYWDRVRVVRVRSFGAGMDYVAAFVVAFHRWPWPSEKIGFQVPAHLIRENWSAGRTPHARIYDRVCSDLKEIARLAEEEEERINPLRGGDGDGDDASSLLTADNSVAESRRALVGGKGKKSATGRGVFGRLSSIRGSAVEELPADRPVNELDSKPIYEAPDEGVSSRQG